MPTSSTGATCGDGLVANESRAATGSATQAAAHSRVLVSVPNDPHYSLSRFLNNTQEAAPGSQRPPPCFGKTQSDTEAVTEAEARMRKELRAFDARMSGKSSVGK